MLSAFLRPNYTACLLVTVGLFLGTTQRATAQVSCEDVTQRAEASYFDGRLDDTILMLDECLKSGQLEGEAEERAYLLLGRAYFAKNLELEAETALRELLERVPNYQPDPVRDNPPFRTMVARVREMMEDEQQAQLLPSPTLVLPEDGATDQPFDVSLFWRVVANAQAYDVQVAQDTAFASLVADTSGVLASVFNVSLPDTVSATYFWRVRSINAGGLPGGWPATDAVFQFSTTQPPASVVVRQEPPAPDPETILPPAQAPGRKRGVPTWALVGGGAVVAGAATLVAVLMTADGDDDPDPIGGIPLPPGRP